MAHSIERAEEKDWRKIRPDGVRHPREEDKTRYLLKKGRRFDETAGPLSLPINTADPKIEFAKVGT